MKVMVDLNVLVDVLECRRPFLLPSAKLCDFVKGGRCEGYVAAHAITTLFYIIRKCVDKAAADRALDWIFSTFNVAVADKTSLLSARTMNFVDFEDAVVAASASAIGCDFIATRNIGDYRNSPIKAVTPEELLQVISR